jgi:RHS repeat-associated protein
MLRKLSSSLVSRVLALFSFLSFVLADTVQFALAAPKEESELATTVDRKSEFDHFELSAEQPTIKHRGLELAIISPSANEPSSKVSVLVSCHTDNKSYVGPNTSVVNVTRECSRYSILSAKPIRIGIDFDLAGLEEEIEVNAVKIFGGTSELASLDTMLPLDSFVDRQNSKTVTTLSKQAGVYMAGAIRLLDRASKPPMLTSQDTLGDLKKGNPIAGVPLVAMPEQNSSGELALSYPLSFPGARSGFEPAIGIRYSSSGGYGALGEGWQLELPNISVETRWGTPRYSKDFETETYLLNGQQLVPETGEGYIGNPADALQLVPLPMRTTNLRPRKKGQARFVLRRDEELTRVIRHGDDVSNYWWEVWSEKPKSGTPRIMYFGNAPGRIPGTLEVKNNEFGSDQPVAAQSWATDAGSYRSPGVSESAQLRWELAREVDGHGNIIDYDWGKDPHTRLCKVGEPKEPDCTKEPLESISGGLLLKRVLYTSHRSTEETVLKCKEFPATQGCKRHWALYEAIFHWTSRDFQYVRFDARSGGVVLSNRQLASIDVRGKHALGKGLEPPHLGKQLDWACSLPIVQYAFEYRREFANSGGSSSGTGRHFLEKITKRLGESKDVFLPVGEIQSATCTRPTHHNITSNWKLEFPTRFDYELTIGRKWDKTGELRLANDKPISQSSPFKLVSDVQGALLGVSGGKGKGPLSTSVLGSSVVTNASGSIYLGINFLNYGKTNSFGVKSDYSKRTGYRDSSLFFDVNSDGLNDLIYYTGSGYEAVLGKIDVSGNIGFESDAVSVSSGGSSTFSRESIQSSSGTAVEGHFFGTFLAGYNSKSTTVQDIYMSDVNGDGRVDIVSNGVVYFNNTAGRSIKFDRAQDVSFIDDRDYEGLSQEEEKAALFSMKSALSSLTLESSVENDPRVDAVRYWRAPFAGDVIIRGDVIYAPPLEPSDLRDVPHDLDPEMDKFLREDRRDGLLFTIELNTQRGWDGEGKVRRCFAHDFGMHKGVPAVQIEKIVTPSQSPSTVSGLVPIESCQSDFGGSIPDLPASNDRPLGSRDSDGLIVSVRAGDVVYFRTHVIDNAQDDVIEFDPKLDYVRLLSSQQDDVVTDDLSLAFGVGADQGKLGAMALRASLTNVSSKCKKLPLENADGTVANISEAAIGLCDPWGRSFVRYRMAEEADEFTNGASLKVAPFDGRFFVEGALTKPQTHFPGQLSLLITPRDQVAKKKSEAANCPPVNGQVVEGTKSYSLLHFGQSKGTYAIAKMEPIKVYRGDKICAYLTFETSKDEVFEQALWPEDSSQFSWGPKGLALVFDRQLLYEFGNDAASSPPSKENNSASRDDCPLPMAAPTVVVPPDREIKDDEDPKKNPGEWSEKTIPVTARCVLADDRHWIVPRFASQPAEAFLAKPLNGDGKFAGRYPSEFRKLLLPKSDLQCPVEGKSDLREFRVRLDISAVNGTVDSGLRKPKEMFHGRRAVRKSYFWLHEKEVSDAAEPKTQLLELRPLSFKQRPLAGGLAMWPVPASDEFLVTDFQSNSSHEIVSVGSVTKSVSQEVWQRQIDDGLGNKVTDTDFYIPISVEKEDDSDDGHRLLPTSVTAFSFCAKEGATLEVTSVIEGENAGSERSENERALTRTGRCSDVSLCPILATGVRVAELDRTKNPPLLSASTFSDTNYFPRVADVWIASYRGWGMFSLTTGFKEVATTDDGTVQDPPKLSSEQSEVTRDVTRLPVVRRVNLILGRYLSRQMPFSENEDVARMEVLACGQSLVEADNCKRERFLSQRRVNALVGDQKATAIPSSIKVDHVVSDANLELSRSSGQQDWIYCRENAHRRPATANERASNEFAENIDTSVVERVGLEITEPHLCLVGPDSGIWVAGKSMSASRIGRKDLVDPALEYLEVKFKEKSDDVMKVGENGKVDVQPLLFKVLPRVSSTKTRGHAATAWIGLSQTNSETESISDLIDLNGDSFPDQIEGAKAWITDPTGRFACKTSSVWINQTPCEQGGQVSIGETFKRESSGRLSSLSIPFTSPKTFVKSVASAAGRMSTKVVSESRDPSWGSSLGLDFGSGSNTRKSELIDLNGDGLVDWYKSGGVVINTGMGFGNDPLKLSWNGDFIQDKTNSLGLSASIGYGTDNQEYGGGFAASTTLSRNQNTLADINSDGLVDILKVKGSVVSVALNNGHGFENLASDIASFGRATDAFGQNESDGISASGYFTLSPCIPVPWGCIYIVINPGVAGGASVNRQVITFKDADSDGLPDLLVGGGVRIGNATTLLFDNDKAEVYGNPYSNFGKLKGIYLPTNPDAYAAKIDSTPNYSFTFGKSAPSFNDASSRKVLSSVTINDGVEDDDAIKGQKRRTCYYYEGGQYDRFERRFLGFAKTLAVEGCDTEVPRLTALQGVDYPKSLVGIRRTERTFANQSIYETGLLLTERVLDEATANVVANRSSPERLTENVYALIDTAVSTSRRFSCYRLADVRNPVDTTITIAQGGRIEYPFNSDDGQLVGQCEKIIDRGDDAIDGFVASDDRTSRRLTPVLIQTRLTIGEGESEKVGTALQYQYDHLGRVVRMCDLGRLGLDKPDDDVCSSITYENSLQLSFIHGATGGGTMAYDLRDRMSGVVVVSGNGSRTLRKSSAAYEDKTGDLASVCQFTDTNVLDDPCKVLEFIPPAAKELQSARRLRVAQHFYEYDQRGNLTRYVSPVGADAYFVSKEFDYDDVMQLVEIEQRTDYCDSTKDKAVGSGSCPRGSDSSLYGTYRSVAGEIDWRHAAATTSCDINFNGLHHELDAAGRPIRVLASWNVNDSSALKCASESKGLNSANWLPLVSYDYRLGGGWQAPKVRITRHADARLYKRSGEIRVNTGILDLIGETYADQLGRTVRQIESADVCVPGAETRDGAFCPDTTRASFIASGRTTFDVLDRTVESFLPIAVPALGTIDQATLAQIPAGLPIHSTVTYDGFDRPLGVRLSDGNGYGFSYFIGKGYKNEPVHRTVTRDARCVPGSMDRDIRGNITAVHEFAHKGTENGLGKHAVGSTFDSKGSSTITARGWVKSVGGDITQQVFKCVQGEVASNGEISTPLADPLSADPLSKAGASVTRSSVTYDYDALNQLTAVHLPLEDGVQASSGAFPGGQQIKVAYDGLGRRIATADPDRGFEYLSYDLASNLICQRSGKRLLDPSQFEVRLAGFELESKRAEVIPSRLDGEDMCLAPKPSSADILDRVVRQSYHFDRLTNVNFIVPKPVDGERKNIEVSYGPSSATEQNLAGREFKVKDVTGIAETIRYTALGLPESLTRSLASLQRPGYAKSTSEIGILKTSNVFDSWGMLYHTSLDGHALGMNVDGTNDESAVRKLNVGQASWYRYSPMGQVAELLVGAPCTRPTDKTGEWAVETPDCRDTTPPIRFLVDASFDERGNARRLEYGHGVVTRNEFDVSSNRLQSSASLLGVPCIEFGPGDDCSSTSPPILFQNVQYAYDAAGHVVTYANDPKYAFALTDQEKSPECDGTSICKKHAGIQGLLITASSNKFAYDELGRLKLNKKQLASFDRNPSYLTVPTADLTKYQASRFEVNEEFQFSDNHLLKGIERKLQAGFTGGSLAPVRTTLIKLVYASGRPNAPDVSSIIKPQSPYSEEQVFAHDSRGRLDVTNCSGCLEKKSDSDNTEYASRDFEWDSDDTLVNASVRTEPTEKQNTEIRRRTRYFNEVANAYDRSGNRYIKKARELRVRQNRARDYGQITESLYADERLTIIRQPGKTPEALYHVLNGSTKLASKWIDGEGLFSYHAQLATGSISDVVYARGDDPTTVRIHKQMEYAPFGEMIVGRELVVAESTSDPSGRRQLASPVYRFNAKEYDEESGLTNFGRRHFDQRLALWVSPDPVLPEYLSGKLGGGVYVSKNLSSYSFGWGNPISFVDRRGEYAELPIEAISLALGYNSYLQNVREGSYGWAALDVAGMVHDGVAMALPGYVGGAGLVGPIAAGSLLASKRAVEYSSELRTGMTVVSRWGKSGLLEKGDWVMKGSPDPLNYLLSGKWDFVTGSNRIAGPQQVESFLVKAGNLKMPVEKLGRERILGLDITLPSFLEAPISNIKEISGQRIYIPD